MGQSATSIPIKLAAKDVEKRYDPSEISPDNGYIFGNSCLPEEIIALILSYVDTKSLPKCRLVCQRWCEIIKDQVWKIKAERDFKSRFLDVNHCIRFPSSVYQGICWKDAYGKNLLKNNTGKKGMVNWKVVQSGGNHWAIEKPPTGVGGLVNERANEHTTCFVTSYFSCIKLQTIDLLKEGIKDEIMDIYQPNITVSEWYSARWDCASMYEIEVKLLDINKQIITIFDFNYEMRDWQDGWKEVSHTFSSYGPGVRYICFQHHGKDLQFWAGHYGSKMADARVEIKLSGFNENKLRDGAHNAIPEDYVI